MQTVRQGDVLLVKVDEIPVGAQEVTSAGDVILAYGEVTGHAHRIAESSGAKMWSAGAERFLQVVARAALTHEEHALINLAPGIYRIPQQVEYTPKELVRVQD